MAATIPRVALTAVTPAWRLIEKESAAAAGAVPRNT